MYPGSVTDFIKGAELVEAALFEFEETGWSATNDDGSRALYISFGLDLWGANRRMLVGPKDMRADTVGEASTTDLFCLPLAISEMVGFLAATAGFAGADCVLEAAANTSAGFFTAADFPGAFRFG